jgi:Spy/CpxP family protein refolding chaperone
MKPAIASLALAIVFSGHALVRKSLLAFAAPGQQPTASMMNSPVQGPPGMHPGAERRWWKDSELVQKLHISDDQVQKIDKIAQAHRIQEIDLRADLEKQEAVLRFQMETDTPDEAQVLAQVDKVTQARANLEKSHVQMILDERRVLTTEQARMLRDLRPKGAPQAPGFGPPPGGPGMPPGGGPREGGPGAPPNRPNEPPPGN